MNFIELDDETETGAAETKVTLDTLTKAAGARRIRANS